MEKSTKIVAQILLFLMPLVVMIFFVNKELYQEIIKEDGLIEYLTALLLLTTCILLVIKIVKTRHAKGYKWMMFNVILSAGLFFGFGEEISWGQRIFDMTANDFFSEYNLQGETNLHNLMIGGIKINQWIFSYAFSALFGCYFLFLQRFYKKSTVIKNIVDTVEFPIPMVSQSLIFIAITGLIMIIPDNKKWELWECLFAVILLWIFIQPHNMAAKLLHTKKNTFKTCVH